VRVTEVDVPRKRIGLTMRKDGGASAREDRNARDGHRDGRNGGKRGPGPKGGGPKSAGPKGGDQPGAFGAALLDAMRKS